MLLHLLTGCINLLMHGASIVQTSLLPTSSLCSTVIVQVLHLTLPLV